MTEHDTRFGISYDELQLRKTDGDVVRYLLPLPETDLLVSIADYTELSLRGVIVDVETTGVDIDNDEIISLGYVKFAFNEELTVCKPYETGVYYNEPKGEISEFITGLTGLTLDDVKGQHFSEEQLEHVFGDMEIAIAHHAAFDRGMVDKYRPIDMPWGCTVKDLDLQAKYGNNTSSLASVMAQAFGYYMDHHEALTDCWACYELVNDNLRELFQTVFTPAYRVVARNSDFMRKDMLKYNGFKWDGETKNWYKNNVVADEDVVSDITDLINECGGTPEFLPLLPNTRWKQVNT